MAVRPLAAPDGTRDALFGGRVTLHQPAPGAGYRVNVDALLLAAFAGERKARVAWDLGAGTGAVGLALLHLGAAERVVLVEVDREAATLAGRNLRDNGWEGRGEVRCVDLARLGADQASADLVVCNPPYVAPGRGRPPRQAAKARARSGELALFVRAARVVMRRRARACFVFPAPELTTLLRTLRGAGLEPKRMRLVHATATSPARVVLIEAVAGKPGGLHVAPALIEREDNHYGGELGRLLASAGKG